MRLQLDALNVDRVVGRVAGQFDLSEGDLAQLAYEGHAVLVMIVKADELTVKSHARTGARTLMQVLTPVQGQVAANGLRERILSEMGSEEQLSFEIEAEERPELTEEDFVPPPEVLEAEPAIVAPTPVPAVARVKPPVPIAEELEGPRVVGHIRDAARPPAVADDPKAVGRRALVKMMEA